MKGFFSESQTLQEKPDGLIAKCGACGYFKNCQSPKMTVRGDGAKEVLIVGDFPSWEDDEEGSPFSDGAGDYLKKVLGSLGVRMVQDTWMTNALICHPEKPSDKNAKYCRPNYVQTIAQLAPKVVITLGRLPLVSAFAGSWRKIDALERWVGWNIPAKGHWIVPTWHPREVMQDKGKLLAKVFSEHLEAAFQLPDLPVPEIPQFELIYDGDEAAEAIAEMDMDGGLVAVDYETNCLKPEYPEAKVVSCSIGSKGRTISYLWTPQAAKATGVFLKSPNTKKIASNLKMEERWTLHLFGHGVRNWKWDTMLAAHSLDNRQGITSLKFQAWVELGVPSYNDKIERFLKNDKGVYNRIHEIAPKDLLYYGAMDSWLELRLAKKQMKKLFQK